jgi:hypothetical protein
MAKSFTFEQSAPAENSKEGSAIAAGVGPLVYEDAKELG